MGWLPYSTPGTTGTRPNSLSAAEGRVCGLRVRDLDLDLDRVLE